MSDSCVFCDVRDGVVDAAIVLDTPLVLGLLDHRPLFKGHVLLVPKEHHVTLMDLPPELVAPLFEETQRMSVAVKHATQSHGIFTASNNGVSQSVDHLHVHVIPRNKKDGLRGFMWPRTKYDSSEEMHDLASRIRFAYEGL